MFEYIVGPLTLIQLRIVLKTALLLISSIYTAFDKDSEKIRSVGFGKIGGGLIVHKS